MRARVAAYGHRMASPQPSPQLLDHLVRHGRDWLLVCDRATNPAGDVPDLHPLQLTDGRRVYRFAVPDDMKFFAAAVWRLLYWNGGAYRADDLRAKLAQWGIKVSDVGLRAGINELTYTLRLPIVVGPHGYELPTDRNLVVEDVQRDQGRADKERSAAAAMRLDDLTEPADTLDRAILDLVRDSGPITQEDICRRLTEQGFAGFISDGKARTAKLRDRFAGLRRSGWAIYGGADGMTLATDHAALNAAQASLRHRANETDAGAAALMAAAMYVFAPSHPERTGGLVSRGHSQRYLDGVKAARGAQERKEARANCKQLAEQRMAEIARDCREAVRVAVSDIQTTDRQVLRLAREYRACRAFVRSNRISGRDREAFAARPWMPAK